MCIEYTKTVWHCQNKAQEEGCQPGAQKQRRYSQPGELKLSPPGTLVARVAIEPPEHFTERCAEYNAETKTCPNFKVDDETEFRKTLKCPLHHEKRLKTLRALLEEEWDLVEKDLDRKTDPASKEKLHQAKALKMELDTIIDLKFKRLEADARENNTEFYVAALHWQNYFIERKRDQLLGVGGPEWHQVGPGLVSWQDADELDAGVVPEGQVVITEEVITAYESIEPS